MTLHWEKNIVNFNKYLVQYLPTKYLLTVNKYLLNQINISCIQ